MPRSLQNRLKQHEEMPPPSAWEAISRRLDAEFVSSDLKLSSKVQDSSITPPAPAWKAIATALTRGESYPSPSDGRVRPIAAPGGARKIRVLPRVAQRIAMAAGAAGLILLGALYLFSDRQDTEHGEQPALATTPQTQERLLIAPADEKAGDEESPASPGALAAAPADLPAVPLHRSTVNRAAPAAPVFELPDDIEQANTLAVQTVSSIVPVTVSAPPIRDEQGNLIMDIHVISDPGQPYIVVTSPNGDQTRISRKFLDYLSYLNGDYTYTDMNSEGQQWRTRFDEWRNELLREASFIPTANNFFDIFQLKELIEDR